MSKHPEWTKAVDTSTPAVVLKPFEYCALGILRSLGRLGVPMYLVHDDIRIPAAMSRYCRGSFPWDIDKSPVEESVRFLLATGRRIGRRSILIPNSDSAAAFVAENAAQLREYFLFPEQPAELSHALSNKRGMHSLCQKFGIATPETVFPRSRPELLRCAEALAFPVALKVIDGWHREERDGTRIAIAKNDRELLEAYDQMHEPENQNLMLQEYIPGESWMFNGYFNDQSECLLSFAGKKIRQCPPHTGMASLGVCLRNEVVENTTQQFMKALGYSGMLDVDYRYDRRDGRYKLVDVNPRIGATFRLFVTREGVDVVRAMYLDLTGQPVPCGPPREGRKWMVENNDLIAFRGYRQDRELTLLQWICSLAGVRETAWFALDDWPPCGAMCKALAARFLRLIRKKIQGSDHKAPVAPPADTQTQSESPPTEEYVRR